MTAGQGFQFTPFGFTALGDASMATSQEHPAALPVRAPEPEPLDQEPAPRPLPSRKPPAKPSATISPSDVIRLAKARRVELKAEIKRLRALEKELKQIDRLLDAASGKKLAPVRALDSARRVS